MPTLKGSEAEQRRRDQIPDKIKRILRGAARVGATVIADEAKARVASDAVRNGVEIGRSKDQDGTIKVRITVQEGWPRSLGTWLEYGTSAHFISVDPRHSQGRTAARVNTSIPLRRRKGDRARAPRLLSAASLSVQRSGIRASSRQSLGCGRRGTSSAATLWQLHRTSSTPAYAVPRWQLTGIPNDRK